MASVSPFRGIRYGQADLTGLVAPPYDVISDADKRNLLAQNEQNIVKLDLPHCPPKTAGPDEVYEKAAGEMISWLDTHHLIRDPEPALYAYHQTYALGDQTLTRKMFFARLRLEPFGTGAVFPHEQIFGGPKEDRLKLTIATRCNMSPIFGLYPDPKNEIAAVIDQAIEHEPDATAFMDGVQNHLWVIDDADAIDEVRSRLADRPIYIADGHHRYSTALDYERLQSEQAGGESDAGAPFHHVLMVLGGMQDPGATIRPYFRVVVDVAGVKAAALAQALEAKFDCKTIDRPQNDEGLARAVSPPGAFALYVAGEDRCLLVVPRDGDPLADLEPDRDPSWRRLPYAVLHRLVIDEVLPALRGSAEPVTVHYHRALSDAIADAHENAGIAALMPATTMAQLEAICAAGELMPQKSTCFHPKLLTGMVINPLY